MNKRERYTPSNLPEKVAILYNRFIDKSFVSRAIQFMVFDVDKNKDEDKINFNEIRFAMFKVNRTF